MNTTKRAEIVGDTIDAILTHLATEEIPHSLADTGGGCLCVRVDLADSAWIWISDDAGNLVTCRYEDDDDTGECLAYRGTLDFMAEFGRARKAAREYRALLYRLEESGAFADADVASLRALEDRWSDLLTEED